VLAVAGVVLIVIGLAVIAAGVCEWRARDRDTRDAIEDMYRTAHYQVLMGRIRVLCRYPGARPTRRPT